MFLTMLTIQVFYANRDYDSAYNDLLSAASTVIHWCQLMAKMFYV